VIFWTQHFLGHEIEYCLWRQTIKKQMRLGARSRLQKWLAWSSTGLLLMAVLLRALIPAGFMPAWSETAGGLQGLVICTAQGFKVIADPGAEQEHPTDKAFLDHDSCTILASPIALPPLSLGFEFASAYGDPVHWPHFDLRTPPARAGPYLSIRGPPVIV
jgi:hypothetical protein